jgi:SAM-dependent methyltransferase
MRFDIDRLQTFYASPMGRMAHEMMAKRVMALWPSASGLDVLGIGHAEALLEPYRGSARRVVSAAPEEQGAERWPAEGRSLTVLTEEDRLPFPDALFDRIIVCHALEEAESPRRLLREIWRVAAPEARILIIVANRRGLWARAESTPFGHGRPYTRTQLNRLLEESMFAPQASARALYAPPIGWGIISSAGDAWERIGRFAWSGFGGVLMVEALKRLYIEPGKPARGRRVVKVPEKQRTSTRVDKSLR